MINKNIEIIIPKKEDILLNKNEVFRYLGYKKTQTDKKTEMFINECAENLLEEISFKACLTQINIKMDKDKLMLGNVSVKSNDLATNLADCDSAYVFALTVGIGADRLINKASVFSQSKAVIYNALGSAYAESFADFVNSIITKRIEKSGKFTRPRFSVGYGDFSLEYQKDIIGLLNAYENIGLSVTESNTLLPIKSITAVIGISTLNKNCRYFEKCENCNSTNCPYRC